MNGVMQLQLHQVVIAYFFVLVLLIIVRFRGISREKEIAISTFRMTIQLVLTGYVLVYIFDNPYELYTILIILFMEGFAVHNTIKRVKVKLSKSIKKVICISMFLGTLSTLTFFVLFVIQINPWYDPRYLIPITGMIIGNSMTGISLAVTKLISDMYNKRSLIESALMLGATPKMASKEIVDSAFDSSILPTINSMVGIGIVFLPGMMTGQILSGTSPLIAIEYQIVIMLAILGGVSLSAILFVQLGYKTFFNNDSQLVFEKSHNKNKDM